MTRKETSLKQGDVLAERYRIERVIAMGGMGVVVEAKHLKLGHRVAIKVLHENTASPQTVARFLSEAKALAQLHSEHVVKVSDVGQLDSGEPFMVMELLEGMNLADVVHREGPMSTSRAVEYVLAACEGIAEAHAARIVHRDLKPENIFRATRSNGSTIVKVLDFGVSKAISQDVRVEGMVTQTDAVFGSPLYMSPEQMVSATKADERSDIWSLGIVLYELVAGRTPFDAENMAGLAIMIATQPPRRLRSDAPGAPPELEAVIEKCLQKDPAQRYPNIGEFAADLEPFAPGARHHVEAIQRLIPGGVLPSRAVPSAPPSLRNVSPGAETLGPVDAAPSGAPEAPPRRRAWVPFAIAGVVFVLCSATGMLIVQSLRGSSTAASSSATPSTTPAPTDVPLPPVTAVITAPPANPTMTEVATAIANPHPTSLRTILVPSSSSPAPSTSRPTPPVAVQAVTATATATAMPSVITGISHDRK